MKITSITCSMTRQVRQYEPQTFSMQAELTENEDLKECSRQLQKLVIRVLYRDSVKMQEPLMAMIDSDSGTPVVRQTPNVIDGKKLEEPQF